MACDWPVSATNGSTATLHGRELPTELPVQTLCTALAETALSYGLRLLSRIWQIGSRQWRDCTLQPLADLPARNFQVVLRLKVLPQLCRRAEISRQAQRHLGSDCSPPADDLIDCRSRHAKILRDPLGAQFQRLHEVMQQNIARMYWPKPLVCHRQFPWHALVIIHDFHVKGVAFLPLEADSPLLVDPDAVLTLTITP